MKMIAVPSLSLRSARRSRICAWMLTSSAVVGSSAMIRRGEQAMAMAIITRWRMPPDRRCGYSPRRTSGSGMRTRRSISSARSRAAAADSP